VCVCALTSVCPGVYVFFCEAGGGDWCSVAPVHLGARLVLWQVRVQGRRSSSGQVGAFSVWL
jgi:hypothetical protein